jgi:hypothetical protein
VTNKITITHPSEDHGDAFWIEDGKVVILVAKDADNPVFGRGHRIVSAEHVIPKWMLASHHAPRCDERPPKAAERLLDFIPLKYREHLLGDLEEMYTKDLRERGVEEAQRRYWKQVWLSLLPIIWTVIKEVAGLAILLKWIT